jgi:hypothetical protein
MTCIVSWPKALTSPTNWRVASLWSEFRSRTRSHKTSNSRKRWTSLVRQLAAAMTDTHVVCFCVAQRRDAAKAGLFSYALRERLVQPAGYGCNLSLSRCAPNIDSLFIALSVPRDQSKHRMSHPSVASRNQELTSCFGLLLGSRDSAPLGLRCHSIDRRTLPTARASKQVCCGCSVSEALCRAVGSLCVLLSIACRGGCAIAWSRSQQSMKRWRRFSASLLDGLRLRPARTKRFQ